MLRSVRFKNFINFAEEEFLQFKDDGVHLFVGENNSGKSSVLEAIRRCTGMTSNFSFSMNVPNAEDPTLAVCDFSLPDDLKAMFNGCKSLVTAFVRIPSSASAKVVLLSYDGEGHKDVLNMDIILAGDYVRTSENISCPIEADNANILIRNLKELPKSKNTNSNEFLKTVSEVIKKYMEGRDYKFKRMLRTFEPYFSFVSRLIGIIPWLGNSSSMKKESTETERILNKLGVHVVFTFGSRAVGGVQWDKSSNLSKGRENYSSSSERCEIIRWFCERKGDANYDISKAKKILKILTGGECFSFDFKESNGFNVLVVRNGSGKTFSILKCPEGIIEATNISLLLSYKPFRTLLLEEPDRGMHPQMIHRLRSIILPAEQNKNIIIVTHNAAFISPKLIPRIFRFCKTRQAIASDRFHIVNIGDVVKLSKEPIPRIGNENYASVLFAKLLLFVEGESELIFIKAMFSNILDPKRKDSTNIICNLVSELHKKINGENLTATDLEKFNYLLTSLHVLKLDGHGDKDKWKSFSDKIHTPHIFLLDADAVVETIKSVEKEAKATKCANAIHEEVIGRLLVKKIDEKVAQMIAEFLRKKFLDDAPSLCECKTFSNMDESTETIVNKSKDIDPLEENIDMDKLFGEIDAKFYGKIYADNFEKLTIEEPEQFNWKPESKIEGSIIVKKDEKIAFASCLKTDWIDARNQLTRYNIFVWKDGSVEDAILDLVWASTKGSPQTKEQIFRRYIAFHSLKMNLRLESFHTKHKTKLYLDKSISYEDIENSIDQIFKFCTMNSDIVHFLHFLTMYAMANIVQV